MHPVNGNYTQRFGQANQASGQSFPHTGDDYAANRGDEVRTIAPGTVIFAGNGQELPDNLADRFMLYRGSPSAGKCVFIQHDGWIEYFAHLDSINVRAGQTVSRGTRVGGAGDTGNAQGVHLHYEVFTLPCSNVYPFGRYNPANQVAHEDSMAEMAQATGVKMLTVTGNPAMVRTSPRVAPDNIAPDYPEGIAQGAQVAAVGYVAGQDPYPNDGVQDDAWIKTVSGLYIWANALGDDLSGLPKL